MNGKPSVLFVCVKNGGKSQMAAGLMSQLAGDQLEVRSAGTRPGHSINALSAASLAELGIVISSEVPEPLTDDVIRAADVVVVLGRDAQVQAPDGTRIETWDTDEPSLRGIRRHRTDSPGPGRHSSTRPTAIHGTHQLKHWGG